MSTEYTINQLELDEPFAVLEARGRFDLRAVWNLQLMCESLYTQGYSFIVVQMSGVTFIASSGAATLVNMTYNILARDGLFQIAAVSGPVMKVIDMLDSRQFLNITADVDEARAKLGTLSPLE